MVKCYGHTIMQEDTRREVGGTEISVNEGNASNKATNTPIQEIGAYSLYVYLEIVTAVVAPYCTERPRAIINQSWAC
jgi:hypothetical protein